MKKKYIKQNNKIPIALIIGESTGLESFKKILSYANNYTYITYVVNSHDAYKKQVENICKQKKIKFYSKIQFKNKIKEILKLNKKSKILLSIYSSIILNKKFLKSLNYMCFNFHPGILPFYPGKNCVSGAIYNGEKQIGITVHKMNSIIDNGKILFKKKVKLSKNDNLLSAMFKLRKINLSLLKRLLLLLKNNQKFNLKKNDRKKIKIYPKVVPNFGLINDKLTFKKFKRIFNASFSGPFFNSWGRIYFKFAAKKKIYYSDSKKK